MMRSIGAKINDFDNSDCTVKTFNSIFKASKLRGVNDSDLVEIGEIHSAGTTRFIKIGDNIKIIDLLGNNDRKPNTSNPLVVLYNDSAEIILNNKSEACKFLGISECVLNVLRTYDDVYKGYYVEYKDRNGY